MFVVHGFLYASPPLTKMFIFAAHNNIDMQMIIFL